MGAPIIDLLLTQAVRKVAEVIPLMITTGEAGSQVSWGDEGLPAYRISKRELVSTSGRPLFIPCRARR